MAMQELKYDFKLRTRRFLYIVAVVLLCLVGLGVCYFSLQDTHRILNYYFYPVLIYLGFKLFYHHDSTKGFSLSSINRPEVIRIFKSFIHIVVWSLFSAVSLILFLALFINITLENAVNLDFSSEIIYCLTNIFWLIPWPIILTYIWFYSILLHKHAINNMQVIVNKIYPSEIKNNTINNAISILYNVPFIAGSCLLAALVIYISYIYFCNVLAMIPLQGPSIGCILICLVLIFGIVQRRCKTFLRTINYAAWPIATCFLIYSLMYLLILISATFIMNYLIPSEHLEQMLVANYSFHQKDTNSFLIDGLIMAWWFCSPLMAVKYIRLLPNTSSFSEHSAVLLNFFITLFAIMISYLILFFAANIVIELYHLILSLNLKTRFCIILLSYVGFIYYLFGKHKDRSLLIVSYLQQTKENKFKAASKSYYLLFIITGALLTFLLLENILYICLLLALGSLINLLLLIVMLRGYNRNLNKIS